MFAPRFVLISEPIRGIVRPALRGLREIPVHSRHFVQRVRGPMAVFLPAYGPEGAALLRIYRIAEALRAVSVVMAGSQYIADWCRNAGARHVDLVWTGAPVTETPIPRQETRPPVIAWAQSRPVTYTREVDWVQNVTTKIADQRLGVTLRLFDRRPSDDPGFVERFRSAGVQVDWQPVQPYAVYLRMPDDVALGFAPLAPETPFSRGKSFGKILAFLDRHVPVLASDTGEPARF